MKRALDVIAIGIPVLSAFAIALTLGTPTRAFGAPPEEKKEAAAGEEKKGPPFGERAKAAAPRPAERTVEVAQEKFAFSVNIKPGIPMPGQVAELMIVASSIPKTPHPTFGTRVPLANARIVAELTNPAGEVIGRYLAHPMPLARGKYGLHLTPSQDGIFTLTLKGNDDSGAAMEAVMKLPVNVWPLPADLESGSPAASSSQRRPIKM